MKRKLPFLITAAWLITSVVYAQENVRLPLTADSLATGNYKDVLNSFFQLAFDRITGPDKEIKFTANPYAVMAKLDTSLLIDREYYRYRRLRDLNFSFAVKLDTSYKFNGFSSGLKYALINRRDETVSKTFLNMMAEDHKVSEFRILNEAIEAYISGLAATPELQDKIRAQQTNFTRGNINFNQLEPSFQDTIKKLADAKGTVYLASLIEADPEFNLKATAQEVYEDKKNYFNNRLLWTLGITDTTYQDQFMFSNIVISSELLKGIDSLKKADIELNLKAGLQYVDDTVKSGKDLKRSVFSFEPGINFVIKTKKTNKSFFEFKLSGSYYHTFSTLYSDEERNRLTINSTIRIRILNDIWIPLEIKYDPESGNFFGLFNVRANFTGLGKLVN